jgi:hypothetical protein
MDPQRQDSSGVQRSEGGWIGGACSGEGWQGRGREKAAEMAETGREVGTSSGVWMGGEQGREIRGAPVPENFTDGDAPGGTSASDAEKRRDEERRREERRPMSDSVEAGMVEVHGLPRSSEPRRWEIPARPRCTGTGSSAALRASAPGKRASSGAPPAWRRRESSSDGAAGHGAE